VVECVETQDKIDAILPELDAMVGGGLITLEKVNVITYRPHETNEGRASGDKAGASVHSLGADTGESR
jgi:hypothetical protein